METRLKLVAGWAEGTHVAGDTAAAEVALADMVVDLKFGKVKIKNKKHLCFNLQS